ncbi:MAG: outer membrane beta-barrel protein [Gammaproteobacteria bacterium]
MRQAAKICFSVLGLSMVLSSAAIAANEGGYAGLGIGTSRLEYLDNLDIGYTYTKDTGGVGGRIFAGYNFNEYIGLESGFTTYANTTYNINSYFVQSQIKSKLTALDVVVKGYLPVADSGFDLYALAGGAVVYSKLDVSAWNAYVSNYDSSTNTVLRPKFGLGVSYSLPSTPIVASVEASRIFGQGNVNTDKNAVPNADMISFNLAYSFN